MKTQSIEQQQLIFEEIKEEDDGEENDDDTMANRTIKATDIEEQKIGNSPKDASGGAYGGNYLPTSLSGMNSPPSISSPVQYFDHIPSSSLGDNIKSSQDATKSQIKTQNRPSTRFEMAF